MGVCGDVRAGLSVDVGKFRYIWERMVKGGWMWMGQRYLAGICDISTFWVCLCMQV